MPEMNYEIRGAGEPVVLLHGWGCCIATFAAVADYFERAGKRVLSVDFPGHGDSPEPEAPWGVSDFADCLARLLEKENISQADVIGHSFGGRVAIMLAATRPELVKRLVLTDAAGVLPKRGWKYYYNVYKYKIGKQMAKCGFLDRALRLNERAKNAGSDDYKNLSDNMKATFVKVVNQDLTPFLSSIKQPTLLIWGENDADTPMYMAKIMEQRIADSALIVFNGAGHFAYLNDINKFCAITGAFFGG